jgi:hypothetical protein
MSIAASRRRRPMGQNQIPRPTHVQFYWQGVAAAHKASAWHPDSYRDSRHTPIVELMETP